MCYEVFQKNNVRFGQTKIWKSLCTYEYGGQRTTRAASPQVPSTFFIDRILTLAKNSPNDQSCLASDLQRSTDFFLPPQSWDYSVLQYPLICFYVSDFCLLISLNMDFRDWTQVLVLVRPTNTSPTIPSPLPLHRAFLKNTTKYWTQSHFSVNSHTDCLHL